MNILSLIFHGVLLLCTVYATFNGGRTGIAGSAIFVATSALTAAATRIYPDWAGASLGLFAIDCLCLLALIVLALVSDRYWPIWASGFQMVAVATHFAMISIPDILPTSFQALLSIWAIPMILVMVMGTQRDRQMLRSEV